MLYQAEPRPDTAFSAEGRVVEPCGAHRTDDSVGSCPEICQPARLSSLVTDLATFLLPLASAPEFDYLIEQMALKPGTLLGPHEIISLIGQGGMGEVYKARDTRLDRIVAIKTLPAHLAERPDLRERFKREASTLANLKHAHICVLYDIGHQELAAEDYDGRAGFPSTSLGAGQPAPRAAGTAALHGRTVGIDYLVMEYLEGETLAQRLAKGPLSPPPTRAILRAEVSYNHGWYQLACRFAKWRVSKISFSPCRWMRNPARPGTWSMLGTSMWATLGTTSIRGH